MVELAKLGVRGQYILSGRHDKTDPGKIFIPASMRPGEALADGDPWSASATDPPLTIRQSGYKSDIDTTQREEVCGKLDGAYAYQAVAAAVRATTTNGADVPDGTGLRTLLIEGTNANGAYQQEILTLRATAGTADTTANFLRVNSIRALTAGTGLVAAGAINMTHPAGTSIGLIDANQGNMLNAIYSVPAGYNLMITEFAGEIRTGIGSQEDIRSVLVTLQVKESGQPWILHTGAQLTSQVFPYVHQMLDVPVMAGAGADVAVFVSAASANSQGVGGQFAGFLMKNAA